MMTPELAQAISRFEQEMSSVDELVQVLLKGHLLIEEALTRILELHLFHPPHLMEARLRFHQKVALARALCLGKSKNEIWNLIGAINALRNDLAHNLNSAERKAKLERMKDIYLRETDTKANEGSEPDHHLVAGACALCAGFLSSFESDAKSFQGFVQAMANARNKNELS